MSSNDLWLEGWINQQRRQRGLPLVHQSFADYMRKFDLVSGFSKIVADQVVVQANPKPAKSLFQVKSWRDRGQK